MDTTQDIIPSSEETLISPAQRLEEARRILESTTLEIEEAQREIHTTLQQIQLYRSRRSADVAPVEKFMSEIQMNHERPTMQETLESSPVSDSSTMDQTMTDSSLASIESSSPSSEEMLENQ
jgi:hypothetical protein